MAWGSLMVVLLCPRALECSSSWHGYSRIAAIVSIAVLESQPRPGVRRNRLALLLHSPSETIARENAGNRAWLTDTHSGSSRAKLARGAASGSDQMGSERTTLRPLSNLPVCW